VTNSTPWDTFRPSMDGTGYIKKVLSLMPHANFFATLEARLDGRSEYGDLSQTPGHSRSRWRIRGHDHRNGWKRQ